MKVHRGDYVKFSVSFVIFCIVCQSIQDLLPVMASAHGRKGALVEVFTFVGDCGCSIFLSCSAFTADVITVSGVGLAMPGWVTGLNPEGAVPNTGIVAVGANEIMGGVWKATLKRGSGSAAVRLAGGEKWSGEALGGVRGAYGMVVAGMATAVVAGVGFGSPI